MLCSLFLLASSCIKRVGPDPGSDRAALAGIPVAFGQREEVPEGSEVVWDFGDGTQATGMQVSHAFPRAGVYTIVETIRDKDGKARTARTHVVAARRNLPMAVPGDVRAALMLPEPWKKVALHREIARKLSLGAFFDEVARTVGDAAGFDALDPKAAADNGFDPDKGVAFFTVPQDPEALVFAVGTLDDQKSLAAARRLLTSPRGAGRFSAGPFQLEDSKLAGGSPVVLGQNQAGDKVAIVQRYGYLYIRTAGRSDPLIALRGVGAIPSDKGLAADPVFVNASRHIGNGDAIFFSRSPDGQMRFSNEIGASAFAILENPDILQVRIWSQLKNLSGDQMVNAFKPSKEPPDLAAKLPSGASSYARFSGTPDALWRELSRTSPGDATRLRDRIQEATGLDVEKDLLPSSAGNVGIAVYLDASSLIEAIMGEEVGSLDQSSFVVAAQLSNPQPVKAALERVMAANPGNDRAEINGAQYYRVGDGAQAAIKDDTLFLVIGGVPPQAPNKPAKRGKKPPPRGPINLGILTRVLQPSGTTLSQELKRIGVQGFQVPGQQNIWVNVGGIVKSIERAGTEQGGIAGAGTRLFAERAADLRDALFEARPGKDGVDADLWIRFLSRKAAAR
ncbi:MAG: PKD domain-containing protein [Myxococcales bacterium]